MIDVQAAKPSTEKLNSAPRGNHPANSASGDEINILEIVYIFVKYKTLLIIICVLGLVGGHMAAVHKGPTYIAEATIIAKESDRQSPNFGAFGAFGGLAGQLNLAGNPGLERIMLYLNSRQFNSELIEKYDLTPGIYAQEWPKIYQQFYDTVNGQWNESEEFTKPEAIKLANFLRSKFFRKSITKEGTLELQVRSSDSLFSYSVLHGCLEHLNHFIRTTVQADARENVNYLEKQLFSISDPLLREKLQEMIASEIEKAMIVSKEAFKVIDRPFCYRQHKEKRLYPIAGAFALFFVGSMILIFCHYIFGAGNTDNDSRKWVNMIRREMKRIF